MCQKLIYSDSHLPGVIVVVWFDGGGGNWGGTWGPRDAECRVGGSSTASEVGQGQQEENIAAKENAF